MSGHNKWSKIKRLKGATDAKRSKLFSNLGREITVAARAGGGDESMNPRLRTAINTAKQGNMPNDNIDRAIKKGTGELDGGNYDEMLYEGYGPNGIAILLETATDNKNRTAADIRMIFSKNGGNLGTSGSVAYLFSHKGQITVPLDTISEDKLMDIVIESGGEELTTEEDHYLITTPFDQLYVVAEVLKASDVATDSQKLVYIPETTIPVLDERVAAQVIRLCDTLEDCDDVLNVYTNCDISEEILNQV